MIIFNPKSVFTLAKKEFMDNIRNKWIILLTIIFVILIVFFSYLAGGQASVDDIFGDMKNTVFLLLGISSLIIPLIAIILGFSSISGEAESGSLNVVLSYPISRGEVLLGKLFGLGSVITFSIFLGFGLGGIIISASYGLESWGSYLGFIGLSIFLGFIFLSLSICVSSFCKKRITSIGGGLVIFFWSLIYIFIVYGIIYGTGYSLENSPDWLPVAILFSPGEINGVTVQLAFGESTINALGFSFIKPDFLSIEFLMLAHIIWFIFPLILAYIFFKRRDI